MSGRAVAVLRQVDAVAGYTTYIDLIRPLLEDGRQIIATGMTREIERVQAAVDVALSGRSCAIVSSGDPGIYAMAGLAMEICRDRSLTLVRAGSEPADAPDDALVLEVVPGIPALCAGASLLGAPLTHDFAVISLSDLLTPWEQIEKRIEAAARADFVVVFYNPKSRKRDWQLKKARKILLRHRDSRTPVGVVTAAMRPHQQVSIVPLAELDHVEVGMQTTVFVGSSSSFEYLDFMVTPRGYARKYADGSGKGIAK